MRFDGGDGRAALRRVSYALALVFASVQAYLIVRWLQDISVTPGRYIVSAPLAWLSIVGSVGVILQVAFHVHRRGLGNGLSVAILAFAICEWVDLELPRESWWILAAATGVSIVPGVAMVLAPRKDVVWPTCGVVPLNLAIGWFAAVASVYAMVGEPAPAWTEAGNPKQALLAVGLIGVLGVVLTRLFHPRTEFRPSATILKLASIGSIALLLVLFGLEHASARSGVIFSAATVVTLCAIVHDLVVEWRFRVQHGDLRCLDELHHMYMVPVAARTLTDAGIPVLMRGASHRALFHFFAPYVPVEVYVPESHADAAMEATGGMTRRSPKLR